MGSQINALASVIANQAAPGDLQSGPGGGREGLRKQFVADLKEALDSLNIRVDLSERAAGNLNGAASTNRQMQGIVNGGT